MQGSFVFGRSPMFNLPMGGSFKQQYRAFSVSMMPGQERHDVEKGGKIIMPPSALDQLTRLNIVYPMLFRLTNEPVCRTTHCGVLEFVAEEGRLYLPNWMMRNLFLEEGGLIRLESTSLPIATYSKFRPQQVEFLEITDPKAVLENALRSFACLTENDTILIRYNKKGYELSVLEVKPGNAVSIIECDMNVEFAAPVGYKEPTRQPEPEPEEMMNEDVVDGYDAGFMPFSGSGVRLDGRKGKEKQSSKEKNAPTNLASQRIRGIPNYNYKRGKLTFPKAVNRPKVDEKNATAGKDEDEGEASSFQPFSGSGKQLKPRRNPKK
ncbi:ubiquitin recognition factor in ER-associated degradation protein 1-like [Oscarella lobularis]|uniref:ubiquitin recognition factor in ER-associated degradation protein 1-like n=1 Tax=Oscarella lobularis TaxID=121494 RepID=UPI003313F2D1